MWTKLTYLCLQLCYDTCRWKVKGRTDAHQPAHFESHSSSLWAKFNCSIIIQRQTRNPVSVKLSRPMFLLCVKWEQMEFFVDIYKECLLVACLRLSKVFQRLGPFSQKLNPVDIFKQKLVNSFPEGLWGAESNYFIWNMPSRV